GGGGWGGGGSLGPMSPASVPPFFGGGGGGGSYCPNGFRSPPLYCCASLSFSHSKCRAGSSAETWYFGGGPCRSRSRVLPLLAVASLVAVAAVVVVRGASLPLLIQRVSVNAAMISSTSSAM